MAILERIHDKQVYGRRTRTLADAMAPLIPANARVLDVGCGDGLISKMIQDHRPDTSIEGIDVLLRPKAHIPVSLFDGSRLPYADGSFDTVMFVDVLHHTDDPAVLLREAARVSTGKLLIKDHMRKGLLAGPTLYFMDWVGNARHGVVIPANYWPEPQWRDAFARTGLEIEVWNTDIPLYPWWATWAFGRSLHFIARLAKGGV